MAQPVSTSPYSEVADALATIIDTEFSDLGVTAEHDYLHDSLGAEARAVGVSPIAERPRAGELAVQETNVRVQFFDFWEPEADPTASVDPRIVAGYAQRLRDAIRVARTTGTDAVWFFDVVGVEYPRDPVGNLSRFVATVRAYGNNSALVETIA